MSSITELPESVRLALRANPESEVALWQWVSEQHYAAVVEQNREHLLVFVKEAVDFAPMEQACVGLRGKRDRSRSTALGNCAAP